MKALFITVLILLGAQSAFAGGHCNTAIANEKTDKIYLNHETKEPITYQACMKNLTNALKIAVKLCDSRKIPNKNIATISATYYSQDGNLTELISEGFYNCTHKKSLKHLAKKRKSSRKARRTIASRR